MKRKLMAIGIIGAIFLTGCNSSNGSGDGIKVMTPDKAEEVVKSEYASRIMRLIEDTTGNDEIVLDEDEKAEKEDEYDKKYLDSEILEEKFNGGNRDRYRDFTEGASTFKTDDNDINKLHAKLIEVTLDIYSMYDEKINLAYDIDAIYKKSESNQKDSEKLEESEQRVEILDDMIENQEEHAGNILAEIGTLLGLN